MNINLPSSPTIKLRTQVLVSPSRFTLFEVGLLVVVIGLFGWFIVMPKMGQLEEAETILENVQADKSSLDGEVADLKALIDDMKSKQRQLGFLEEALPIDSRITKLQILIEKMAAESGVTVGDANFNPQAELVFGKTPDQYKNPYSQDFVLKTISGSVYVLGAYDQLKDFLKRIELSGRIIDVVSIDLLGNNNDQLELKLNVQSYYFTY